jgi:hypothetical protein
LRRGTVLELKHDNPHNGGNKSTNKADTAGLNARHRDETHATCHESHGSSGRHAGEHAGNRRLGADQAG